MNGIKINFAFEDLARKMGTGLGSVKLKDGSSVKILSNPHSNITNFYHVKNGRLLGAYGSKNDDDIISRLCKLDRHSNRGTDIDDALTRSYNVIV